MPLLAISINDLELLSGNGREYRSHGPGIALLDPDARGELEKAFVEPCFDVDWNGLVPTLDDYREVPLLEVRPPDVARYFVDFTQNESCGKCTFCRIGTAHMLAHLKRMTAGEGRPVREHAVFGLPDVGVEDPQASHEGRHLGRRQGEHERLVDQQMLGCE
mgnify:CR=1 FL=1